MLPQRLPAWFKREIPAGKNIQQVQAVVSKYNLDTVCYNAKCPNIGECFSQRKVTFLILGNTCTRHCKFCAVNKGRPSLPLSDEPERVAMAASDMDLTHVIVTSVTRDDLCDGGASHFRAVIQSVRDKLPQAKIEVLIPDFNGVASAVYEVVAAKPFILAHNLETIARLYPVVRPGAEYHRSLRILKWVKDMNPGIITKSGLMLGLGESMEEVLRTLDDLGKSGCDIITLGQYLSPSQYHLPVARFVHPQEFEWLKIEAEAMGFKQVLASPFMRSSYQPAQR